MPWRGALLLAADILHEQVHDVGPGAGTQGHRDQPGTAGDFRHHRPRDDLRLDQRGAGVLEPAKPLIQLERLIGAAASRRPSVTVKKKRKADTAALMPVAEAPPDRMCS